MPKILLLEDIPEASAWLKLQIAQVFPDAEFHDTSRVHEALTLIEKVQFEFALIDHAFVEKELREEGEGVAGGFGFAFR